MKKISNNLFFAKKVFPIFFFGFLGLFFLFFLGATIFGQEPKQGRMVFIPFFIAPILMGGFAYFIMKHLVFNLVDEVYDCATYLLVKNKGQEDKIMLADILNINTMFFCNPPQSTLVLAKPCLFGKQVSFSPINKFIFNPFKSSRVIDDLIVRIDQAKRKQYADHVAFISATPK